MACLFRTRALVVLGFSPRIAIELGRIPSHCPSHSYSDAFHEPPSFLGPSKTWIACSAGLGRPRAGFGGCAGREAVVCALCSRERWLSLPMSTQDPMTVFRWIRHKGQERPRKAPGSMVFHVGDLASAVSYTWEIAPACALYRWLSALRQVRPAPSIQQIASSHVHHI